MYVRYSILCYIPMRLLGVWVTLDPAPGCRGVPGTMIFDELPLEVLTASASSAAFLVALSIIVVK
jgi:hypothetical protein